MKSENPIYVAQPYLPPLEKFQEYLKQIWENKWLTNNGPFHEQLEKALADYLGVKYISLFSNGMLALITALQTLEIKGEVITTPFSFVATTHALHWNGIKPVFCDIEPDFFNIDPEKIEALISPYTTAILPVHIYGNPCNVGEINRIAKKHNLKVIYDAAHTFGVQIKGNSILNFGNLSILSFHATKVFNTFEGGAIVCHEAETKKHIDYLKNFGFEDEVTVVGHGINAKMNEVQAAMGLLQLKYIDEAIEKRKRIAEIYREQLKQIAGITVLEDINGVKHNYAYFPILIDSKLLGKTRDEVYEYLKTKNIYTRRYFYPLISTFSTYEHLPSSKKENLPVAHKTAEQVLCLPIYPDLEMKDIHKIINLL